MTPCFDLLQYRQADQPSPHHTTNTMTTREAVHTCRQCGYLVNCLPARTGRPEELWSVKLASAWGIDLPDGGKFTGPQLVAFTEALP